MGLDRRRDRPLHNWNRNKGYQQRRPFREAIVGAPGQSKSEPFSITETEVPRETSVSERKKDSADVQFSRRLRKPRKRNGAEFF